MTMIRIILLGMLIAVLAACGGAAPEPAAQAIEPATLPAVTATVPAPPAAATAPPQEEAPVTLAADAPAASTAAPMPPTPTEASADPAPDTGEQGRDIALQGDTIAAEGAGVTVAGSRVTLTAAGSYRLHGTLNEGQIIVDTPAAEAVTLILDGVTIHNSSGAPLYVMNAEDVVIVLAEGTQNQLSDGSAYQFASPESDEPNAALFSAADLLITGTGALTVQGAFNDGIASKDSLLITGGAITVNAADDGIRGKDSLVIQGGTLAITAKGDGLKADNAEDATRGYVAIEGGEVTVTAGGDAIQAETDVRVTGGVLALTAGGGSQQLVAADASAKGVKGGRSVTVAGGTLTVDAADDALHANGSVTVEGGSLTLASGDDAIHGDASLTINEGEIRIARSYEGLESAAITMNGGTVHLVSSDDGVNVAGGVDGSGMGRGPGRGGPGAQSQETFTYTGDTWLTINGGTLVVDAAGDGLDANGAIRMTGGVVLVNGPTQRMNGALDYDGGFIMTGGLLVAAGSAGMAQAPGGYSEQNSLLVLYPTTQAAGTLVHLRNSVGEELLTFAPTKAYQAFVFSSPTLVQGEQYTLYSGGSAAGSAMAGWYQPGSYATGAEYASFTVSSTVTTLGAQTR